MFVEVEVTLAKYYQKKTNLYEIDKILSKNNFELYSIDNFVYDKKHKLKWLDLLYKKN